MLMVYEDAVWVLLALIGATLLCSVYVMFLLFSKGVRILAAYGVKVYAQRRSVERKMDGGRASLAFGTAIPSSLPAAACDIPSDQP